MRIFIPIYLRDIPVISQLTQIYTKYSETYTEPGRDSMDAYRESMKRDPVKYFVGMCFSEEELGDTYSGVIDYISKLFETVKGTKVVFDYMKKYLNDYLDIQGEPIYTGQYVNIQFGHLVLTDEELFYTSLRNFLGSLLVFEDLITNVGDLGLTVKDEITNYVASDVICYKKYEINYEAGN